MRDLIAKLEALDGPSREAGYEIISRLISVDDPDAKAFYGSGADITASLDAAIALADWVIGEDWALELLSDVAESAKNDTANGTLAGLPIAMLIATLKALEARDATA